MDLTKIYTQKIKFWSDYKRESIINPRGIYSILPNPWIDLTREYAKRELQASVREK